MLKQFIDEENKIKDQPVRSMVGSIAESVTYSAKTIGSVARLAYYTVDESTMEAKLTHIEKQATFQRRLAKLLEEVEE